MKDIVIKNMKSIIIKQIESDLKFNEEINQEEVIDKISFIVPTANSISIAYKTNTMFFTNFHYVGVLNSDEFFYAFITVPEKYASARCIDLKINKSENYIIDYFAQKIGLFAESVNKVKLEKKLDSKEKKHDVKKI